LSHDSHGAPAEEATVEQPMVLAPARNYIAPLLLTVLVAALVIYLMAISPPTLHKAEEPHTEGTNPTVVIAASPTTLAVLIPPTTTATAPTATASTTVALTAALTAASEPPTAIRLATTVAQAATTEEATASSVPPTTTANPQPTASSNLASSPAAIYAAVLAPKAVAVGGRRFPVAASVYLAEWQPGGEVNEAVWAQRSVAPYVLGIPYSPGNAAVFNTAKVGDSISLRTSDDALALYQLSESRRVPTNDLSALQATAPGLVLLLIGDPASDRLMLRALPISGQ